MRFSLGGVAPTMFRILLDPDPKGNAGGGAGGGSGDPPPPVADPYRDLLAQEVARSRTLQEQLDAFNKTQAEQAAEAERSRLKLVADKEGAEKALEEQRTAWEKKAAEADAKARQAADRHLKAELGRALSLALSGHTWHDGQAAVALNLLAPDFEARFAADGESVVVVEKATGAPADKALADRLSKPPFTHLRPAAQKGGTGAASQQPPPGSGGTAGTITGGQGLGAQLRAAMAAKYGS